MGIVRTKEYVVSYIKDMGYKSHIDEFVSAQTKFDVECPEGHTFDINWNNFQQGKRCPYCSGNKKKTDDEIKTMVENLGFELLSSSRNNDLKLQIRCKKGHISNIKYSNLKNRGTCPKCSNETKRKSLNDINIYLSSKGYKIIDGEYKNNKSKLKIKCEKGHIFESYWRLLNEGYGCCPECNGNRSLGETEVGYLISTLYEGKIMNNDKSIIINPKTGCYLELDLYIPELKKAIEYGSEWTHRFDNTKYKDNQKVIQCKEMGIELLLIDDKKWHKDNVNQVNRVKMFITNKCKVGVKDYE